MNPTRYANMFRRNHWVINQQIKGLSHEDSLLQLPFRGNCLNWVVGHILDSRNELMVHLGEPAFMTTEQTAVYTRGTEPITGEGPDVIPFDSLLEMLESSQTNLVECLKRMPPETLETIIDEESGRQLIDRVEFYNWHETYHVGQLEYLRQLAGTDDSIIS